MAVKYISKLLTKRVSSPFNNNWVLKYITLSF